MPVSPPPAHEPPDKLAIATELRHHLATAGALRQAAKADPAVARARVRLREWQAARLARTHRDLLGEARTGAAAAFFLSDLYGPKDFSERDAQVERLLPTASALLPERALRTLALAVEMDALSERLDAGTAAELALAGCEAIDEASYAAAYRRAGQRAMRERQITLVGEIGEDLDRLTRMPLLAGILRAMRAPARLAGLESLQVFLERGFTAFRTMNGAGEFIGRIVARERTICDRLFAGHPRPFETG